MPPKRSYFLFCVSLDLTRFLDEYVVFVTPTALQLSIFTKILHPDKLDDLAQSSTAESLALINMLTKVSNSPILLKATADKAKAKDGSSIKTIQKVGVDEALRLLPERAQIDDVSLSGAWIDKSSWVYIDLFDPAGKLTALAKLLQMIRSVGLKIQPSSLYFQGNSHRQQRRNVSLFRITHQHSTFSKHTAKNKHILTIGWMGNY